MVTDLPLQVGGLVRCGPGQHPGVAEARPEQHPHDEDEQHPADGWDGRGQVGRQEGTAASQQEHKHIPSCIMGNIKTNWRFQPIAGGLRCFQDMKKKQTEEFHTVPALFLFYLRSMYVLCVGVCRDGEISQRENLQVWRRWHKQIFHFVVKRHMSAGFQGLVPHAQEHFSTSWIKEQIMQICVCASGDTDLSVTEIFSELFSPLLPAFPLQFRWKYCSFYLMIADALQIYILHWNMINDKYGAAVPPKCQPFQQQRNWELVVKTREDKHKNVSLEEKCSYFCFPFFLTYLKIYWPLHLQKKVCLAQISIRET